ncbi:MAG: universal stress protein [Thermosynechococcaceae cyanobacterium]
MVDRILICTNFSDGLYRFVRFTAELATSGFKQIVFLHCVPLNTEREIPHPNTAQVEQSRDRLNAALRNVPLNVQVEVAVESGDAADCIKAVTQRFKPHLIVVGTACRTLLNEKLFGSTTVQLSQHLSIPLLILRPQLISVYTDEELALRARHLLHSLLIPYDGSPSSQYLVDFLGQWVSPPQSLITHCTLCWVAEKVSLRESGPPHSPQLDAQQLDTAGLRLAQAGLEVSQAVRQGNPLTEIAEIATTNSVSAIAIASDHFGRLIEWSIPSFAGELIRQSWHPILYIPIRKA